MAELYKCESSGKVLPLSGKSFTERVLNYDRSKWQELSTVPVNTFQAFITDRCNLRCDGCFYAHKLGRDEMSLAEYKAQVMAWLGTIDRVTLLGGEPTLHDDLNAMLEFNFEHDLKSTIYTNGKNLKNLESLTAPVLANASIRVGVYGFDSGERPLTNVSRTPLPITMVYMLKNKNVDDLMMVAKTAESDFNCARLYISSIRDIAVTDSFWRDTKETLPLNDYFKVVQDFISNYRGKLDLHIARRGVIKSEFDDDSRQSKCRFGNVFPDKKKIICPFDISKQVYAKELIFNKRACNKNKHCILTKIVLKNKCN